jgi:hypothetical protein
VTSAEHDLLRDVVARRSPGLLEVAERFVATPGQLSLDDVDALEDVLGDELIENGANADAEGLNAHGLRIDELIGALMRERWRLELAASVVSTSVGDLAVECGTNPQSPDPAIYLMLDRVVDGVPEDVHAGWPVRSLDDVAAALREMGMPAAESEQLAPEVLRRAENQRDLIIQNHRSGRFARKTAVANARLARPPMNLSPESRI